ncbi:hypothetical protein LMA09_18040 [Enterobacter hormaechei]|nr:hypothetical protein [Enterobacter hormaechei]MCC4554869.1 hypothetical protein [Enterobacter hormaechei]MCC4559372.1 hypothetical protein [Enterobacter hormaechei]MCC4563910.1 hypothetical protein [Enterobacter hormaechei]
MALDTPGQVAAMRSRLAPESTSRRKSLMVFFASDNSFVYLASSAATSRWRVCMSFMVALARLSFSVALSRWSL